MALPNFLVIGAAKAGTTALYNYLNQHPQIYMSPVKEPRYFLAADEDITFKGPGDLALLQNLGFDITDFSAYQGLFDHVSDQIAIGEATPLYLYSAKACESIRSHIPDVKLIALLRHPVERAYSNYLHLLFYGRETIPDFYQAFQAEESRMNEGWEPFWFYKQQGFYAVQLSRYFETFNPSQIKVFLHEDLKHNPSVLMQNIFEFLGVDSDFFPNMTTQHNTADNNKNFAANRRREVLLKKVRSFKPITKRLIPEGLHHQLSQRFGALVRQKISYSPPPLTANVRRKLVAIYRDDILKLQDLIQRDLSDWLVS